MKVFDSKVYCNAPRTILNNKSTDWISTWYYSVPNSAAVLFENVSRLNTANSKSDHVTCWVKQSGLDGSLVVG